MTVTTQAASTTPVVPPDITWRRAPGDAEAHAFSAGPGWTRCVCRARVWTSALQVDPDAPRNPDCELLVNGTEAEKAEAFGR